MYYLKLSCKYCKFISFASKNYAACVWKGMFSQFSFMKNSGYLFLFVIDELF